MKQVHGFTRSISIDALITQD